MKNSSCLPRYLSISREDNQKILYRSRNNTRSVSFEKTIGEKITRYPALVPITGRGSFTDLRAERQTHRIIESLTMGGRVFRCIHQDRPHLLPAFIIRKHSRERTHHEKIPCVSTPFEDTHREIRMIPFIERIFQIRAMCETNEKKTNIILIIF